MALPNLARHMLGYTVNSYNESLRPAIYFKWFLGIVTFYHEGLKVSLQQEYPTILEYYKKNLCRLKLRVHETSTLMMLS